ncbi:MAG: helix-turn-helix transcriptional regulator [Butyrivibrio sp.]|nr:helix-turn-helix transcriptional regulator [Butyrivibrio sp.]
MVEFGEQLRKAREEKGMTQQTLAEQLFVTRQAVSKWECGERYPDLPTTMKISEALDVSLDDLLSGKDMNKVVERNSIIDNNLAEKLILAIYAIFLSHFLKKVFFDIPWLVINILNPNLVEHFNFPVYSQLPSSIMLNILWNIIPKILFLALTLILTYGFIRAAKGTLSPKIIGMIGIVTFATNSMMHVAQIISISGIHLVNYNYVPDIATAILNIKPHYLILIITALPAIIGAVASFFYFNRKSNKNIFPIIFMIMAVLEMILNILFIMNSNQIKWNFATYLQTDYYDMLYIAEYIDENYKFYVEVYVFLLFQAVALWIKKSKITRDVESPAQNNIASSET